PAGDGHAVPLVEPVHLDLVAGLLERLVRELLRRALDLLQGEHVDVLTHGEVDGARHARADRVDVPGGQTHASSLFGTADVAGLVELSLGRVAGSGRDPRPRVATPILWVATPNPLSRSQWMPLRSSSSDNDRDLDGRDGRAVGATVSARSGRRCR